LGRDRKRKFFFIISKIRIFPLIRPSGMIGFNQDVDYQNNKFGD